MQMVCGGFIKFVNLEIRIWAGFGLEMAKWKWSWYGLVSFVLSLVYIVMKLRFCLIKLWDVVERKKNPSSATSNCNCDWSKLIAHKWNYR